MGWGQRFRTSCLGEGCRAGNGFKDINTPSVSVHEEQALPSTTLDINGVEVQTHSYADVRRVLYAAQLQF